MALADYPGFTSGTYRGRSNFLGTDRCINMYPELNESGLGKNKLILTNAPGKNLFCTLGTSPGRGIWSGDEDRFFCVSGSTWYEVSCTTAVASNRGSVGTDGLSVQIFSDGGTKLAIISNDKLYLDAGGAATGANAVEQLTPASAGSGGAGVAMGAFVGGYGIVVEKNTNKVYVSGTGDLTAWAALDVQIWYASQDRIVNIIADGSRRLWLMGRKTAEAWGQILNPGSGFPFQRIDGTAMNTGIAAKFGWALVPSLNGSDQICFLSRSDRGGPRVYSLDGYRTVRISNAAIETMIEQLLVYNTCVANGYVRGGHSFLQLNFPFGEVALVYDFATGWWHERYTGAPASRLEPVGRYHTAPVALVNAENHFWLSGTTGKIYRDEPEVYTEDGQPIYWERTGPNAHNSEHQAFYGTFRLDCEVGVGTSVNGITLECSYDNGRNFGAARARSTAATGATTAKVEWHRNGEGSSFVPRVRGSDAKRIVIAGAMLDAEDGLGY